MPAHPAYMETRGRRLALALLALLICAGTALFALATQAPAQDAVDEVGSKLDELESNVDQQGSLQEQIDSQNAAINDLIATESELRRKEAAVQAQLDQRQAELDQANATLNAERAHLAEVRARLERALDSLEKLLIEIYKSSEPDTLSVVLESASWEDLLTEAEYLDRMQNYDQAVIERVTELRGEIEASVELLRVTQEQIRVARDEVAKHHAEVEATRSEITAQHSQLVAAREQRAASLAALQSREKDLEEELGTSIPGPGERATLIDGRAVPPPDAPLVVKAAIEAANDISDAPYVWGGGHGSFEDSGYDCSGAVSYSMHAAGFLDSPIDSGGFTAWGSPGAGNWITVYANFGHVYAVIAGLRWDTSGGAGPRWHSDVRSPSGFTARHPSGF